MKLRGFLYTACALTALFAGNAAADDANVPPPHLSAPMSFEFKAPEGKPLIGSPIDLEGTARFPERFAMSLPEEEQKSSSFTITGLRLDPPQTEAGVTTQIVHLRVVPFELGSQTFPSLAWSLKAANEAATLRSPPVKMDVQGPDPKSGDVRDIKEPFQPPLWAVMSLTLIVLLTLGLAGYEAWQLLRPKASAQNRTAGPPKPAHEEALEQLEALAGLTVPDRQSYERCAEILRVYLERRFGIPALMLTTTDLLKMMRQAEIDRPVVGLMRDLLNRCDLVKFAKLAPEGPEYRQDIAAAIQIVKATAPKPPAEVAPQAGQ